MATSVVALCAACGDDGAGGSSTSEQEVLVTTPSGPVRGVVRDAMRVFYAIPYAQPPVGDLRWAPPRPAEPWTAPVDGTEPGPWCPQLYSDLQATHATSEDCLQVNVWTSDPPPEGDAPVMVFFHGGSFKQGAAAEPTYVGDRLVREGVVLVTVGYRLGPFGFLAHEALAGIDPDYAGAGNYGLMDQRLALEWVREHVAAFGGDPENVTVFGESAGAESIFVHLLLPESNGLITRAILESAAYQATYQRLEEATAHYAPVVEGLGCAGTDEAVRACLLAATTEEIVDAAQAADLVWRPIVDGEFLTDDPVKLLANLRPDLPVILGTTAAEGFPYRTPALTDEEYRARVEEKWGDDAGDILALYPVEEFPGPADALSEVNTDANYACPARLASQLGTGAGVSMYMYLFSRAVVSSMVEVPRAFHGAELGFVFEASPVWYVVGPDQPAFDTWASEADQDLAEQIVGYWTRFAATGDPNGSEAPTWPRYTAASDAYLELGDEVAAHEGFKAERCDFWLPHMLPQ